MAQKYVRAASNEKDKQRHFECKAHSNVTVPELILLLVAAEMFHSPAIPPPRSRTHRVASARVYNRPAGWPARKEKPRRNITRRAQYPRRVSRCTRIRLARMAAAHRIAAREWMPFLYVKRKEGRVPVPIYPTVLLRHNRVYTRWRDFDICSAYRACVHLKNAKVWIWRSIIHLMISRELMWTLSIISNFLTNWWKLIQADC